METNSLNLIQPWVRNLPNFDHCVTQLGLTPFEAEILGVCIGAALDEGTTEQLTQLHNKPYLTFSLAMRVLPGGHGDALSPQRSLRYWKLVEAVHPPEIPYTMGALRVDERILHYVQGYNYLDERLQAHLFKLIPDVVTTELPPSQAVIATAITELVGGNSAEKPTTVQLVGIDAESKRLIIERISAEQNLTLYHLPTELLPKSSQELTLFSRLWARESALSNVALYLDAHELDIETQEDQVKLVQRFLTRSQGLFFLSTRDVWNTFGTTSFDISKPSTKEQEALWKHEITDESGAIATRLAAQFNLSVSAIHRVGEALRGTTPTLEEAWESCLIQTRPRLDMLAQRITVKATWNDIVLPQAQMNQLREITAQVQNQEIVYDQWGWRKRMSRGLGMTVLFGGESGTGKTFSAEILANHLNLNLYRIDLSQVVSKYIGETEKNLRKLFDAAEDGGAILFFDEADALFGKRTETKSSNDRYANMETNYLLQRLEQYRGLAILTTNLLNNIDDAFMRRVRFILKFPVPEKYDRKMIWRRIFPPETPRGTINYTHLSHFKMAGGSIYNAALNATFRAAQDDSPVGMEHVLDAIRMEFDKSGRLPQPKLFVWPQP